MLKDHTAKAVLCAALGNIIWGFSFLFTKVGLAAAPNPGVMLSHRFLLSALFLSLPLLTGAKKISFKGKNVTPILILVVMQLSYYFFESYGILFTNTTVSGLVLATVPVATIGTGALFLGEFPTRRQALFCIMPVVGVIIMTVSGKELGIITPLGGLFLLLTLFASAIFKTANRKAAETFSSYERTFVVLATSSVIFTMTALHSVDWDLGVFAAPLLQHDYLFSIATLSLLCSIAANLLVNYAAGHMSVFKISSFGSLSTLCSIFAGVVFLHEPMNLSLLLGAVLILIGIRQVTRPN